MKFMTFELLLKDDFVLDDENDHCDGVDPCVNSTFVRQESKILENNRNSSLDSGYSKDRSLTTEWFNSEEAASFLRITVKALRNMTSNGQLPFYKLGRRNRYRRRELETILHTHKRGKQYGN